MGPFVMPPPAGAGLQSGLRPSLRPAPAGNHTGHHSCRSTGQDNCRRRAVTRYNAEGVSGLFNRPRGRRPEWLTESEQATLAAAIFKGPKPEVDGVCTWTREAMAIWISVKFGKTVHPSSLSRILRRMGMSRQKARPVHPKTDAKAQERFQKKASATP